MEEEEEQGREIVCVCVCVCARAHGILVTGRTFNACYSTRATTNNGCDGDSRLA